MGWDAQVRKIIIAVYGRVWDSCLVVDLVDVFAHTSTQTHPYTPIHPFDFLGIFDLMQLLMLYGQSSATCDIVCMGVWADVWSAMLTYFRDQAHCPCSPIFLYFSNDFLTRANVACFVGCVASPMVS